jgi:NAD(P)-dependent dehydrogenase (short-subunit alcohol dehydrogenase family)
MSEKSKGLNERVIVITGATGGLGRVVARYLAKNGARLALVGDIAAELEVKTGFSPR